VTKFFIIVGVSLMLMASDWPSPAVRLTTGELAEILQIHAWRVPMPPKSSQWTIDIVAVEKKTGARHLPEGLALISLRHQPEQVYEFTLRDHGQSSGTLKPCAEPEELPPICDEGFSVLYKDPPICLSDDCSRAIIAEVKPMLSDANKRWIVISQIKTPIIKPDSKSDVVPIR
jgi:hypothetical protein